MNIPDKINFNEFPKPTYEEWKEEAIKSLKGAPFEKKLMTDTYEEIILKPIYNLIDSQNFVKDFVNFPGFEPYLRGNSATGYIKNKWEIAQIIPYYAPQMFNDALINDLQSGQDAINIFVNRNEYQQFSDESVDCGLKLNNLVAFQQAFEGVDLTKYPIYFNSGDFFFEFALLFDSYISTKIYNKNKIFGNLGADILGEVLVNGGSAKPISQLYNLLAKVIKQFNEEYSNFGIITINGSLFHNAGASAVQELAFTFTYAIETINQLLERGLNINEIIKTIRFSFSVSSNFFMEIAKLRAARFIWAKIIKEYDADQQNFNMQIHCATSLRNKTIFDPWVNILRGTVETLAAVLGNANSIEVSNFDFAYGIVNEFSRRIARNTQLVLLYEAHLLDTIDPVAGSYFVDELTSEIIQKTWDQIQTIEKDGGFLNNITNGNVQTELNFIAGIQKQHYKTRKQVLIGTNKYAYVEEAPPKKDIGYHFSNGKNTMYKQKAFLIPPLQLVRFAADFEKLRNKALKFKSEHGDFPNVLLFNFGDLNEWKPRNDFANDFIGIGGFKITNSPIFTNLQEANQYFLSEAGNNPSNIIAICSSDAKYETIVPELVPLIKKKNPSSFIILAGFPEDKVDEYKNLGIDEFIHLKSNVHETLKRIQDSCL
jgi:methylmalonyl-CoA mutase